MKIALKGRQNERKILSPLREREHKISLNPGLLACPAAARPWPARCLCLRRQQLGRRPPNIQSRPRCRPRKFWRSSSASRVGPPPSWKLSPSATTTIPGNQLPAPDPQSFEPALDRLTEDGVAIGRPFRDLLAGHEGDGATAVVRQEEVVVWAAADALRNNMDAAEYKHVVLGLIFLKYISDAFDERREALKSAFADNKSDLYLPDAADRLATLVEETGR